MAHHHRAAAWLICAWVMAGCATTGRCVSPTTDLIGGTAAGGAGAAAAVAGGLGFWPIGLVVGGAQLLWEGGSEIACRAAQSAPTTPPTDEPATGQPTKE
jgi:hypothetical protein